MFSYYISCIYIYIYGHWNIFTLLRNVILSHIYISLMFCNYISCTYSYRLWNILTVIFSRIHISLMFCHYISCIYSYRLWNILTVIMSHINISPYSVTSILYTHLHTLKCILTVSITKTHHINFHEQCTTHSVTYTVQLYTTSNSSDWTLNTKTSVATEFSNPFSLHWATHHYICNDWSLL